MTVDYVCGEFLGLCYPSPASFESLVRLPSPIPSHSCIPSDLTHSLAHLPTNLVASLPIPRVYPSKMPAPPMDVFGIVYIIENAQQFWSGTDQAPSLLLPLIISLRLQSLKIFFTSSRTLPSPSLTALFGHLSRFARGTMVRPSVRPSERVRVFMSFAIILAWSIFVAHLS